MGNASLMAHFAQIDENNIVVYVTVVPDDQEHRGQDFMHELGLEGTWIQTSYNTHSNKHDHGKTPLHGNYAGIGWHWLPAEKLFLPPKPYPSWIVNTELARWEAPVAFDETNHKGFWWYEETQEWARPPSPHPNGVWSDDMFEDFAGWIPPVEAPPDDGETEYQWDEDSQTWVVV